MSLLPIQIYIKIEVDSSGMRKQSKIEEFPELKPIADDLTRIRKIRLNKEENKALSMDTSKLLKRRNTKTGKVVGFVDISVFPFVYYDTEGNKVSKNAYR